MPANMRFWSVAANCVVDDSCVVCERFGLVAISNFLPVTPIAPRHRRPNLSCERPPELDGSSAGRPYGHLPTVYKARKLSAVESFGGLRVPSLSAPWTGAPVLARSAVGSVWTPVRSASNSATTPRVAGAHPRCLFDSRSFCSANPRLVSSSEACDRALMIGTTDFAIRLVRS